MLHPVLPPAPFSIVEPLQPANPVLTGSDTKFHSIAELEAKAQENRAQRQAETSVSPTQQHTTRQDLAAAQTQSAPNPPESFPPNFLPSPLLKVLELWENRWELVIPCSRMQMSHRKARYPKKGKYYRKN
jgi:hypothetical protein